MIATFPKRRGLSDIRETNAGADGGAAAAIEENYSLHPCVVHYGVHCVSSTLYCTHRRQPNTAHES